MGVGEFAMYFLNDQHTFGGIYNLQFNYSASSSDSAVTIKINNKVINKFNLK